MVFNPPTSPEYAPHTEVLKVCGRMINADSNALPEVNTCNLPEVWDCSDDDEPHQNPKNGSKTEMTTASLTLLKFMVIFLLTWQAIFQVSNVAMDKFTSILLNKL